MICPECTAGKHGNCNGDAWDDDLDRPAVCECWEADHHGMHWPVCPWCPERVPDGELDAHMADEHNYPPPRPRGALRPLRDVDAEEADRESDRLDHIHERHLP